MNSRDRKKKSFLSFLTGSDEMEKPNGDDKKHVIVKEHHVLSAKGSVYKMPITRFAFEPLFCFASDFHLDYRQYKLDARVLDLFQTATSIIASVVTALLGCDQKILIFGGDLFDKKLVRPSALLSATKLFSENMDIKFDLQTLLLRGNHDGSSFKAKENDVFLSALDALHPDIHYVEEGTKHAVINGHAIEFVLLSHHGSRTWKRLNDLGATLRPKNAKFRVLVIHALLEGMVPQQHDVSLSDLRSFCTHHSIDLVLCGHYHQRWEREIPRVICAGAPEVLDISNCDTNRGFYVVGVKDDELVSQFVSVPVAREFRDVTIDVGESTMNDAIVMVERALKPFDADDIIVRFTVIGKLIGTKRSKFPISTIAKSLTKPLLVLRKNKLTDTLQDDGNAEAEHVDEMTELKEAIRVMFPNDSDDVVQRFAEFCWDVKHHVELGGKDLNDVLIKLFEEMP